MSWLSYSLIAFAAGLLLTLAFAGQERHWRRLRFVALFAYEMGGILLASLILVTLAQMATAPGQPAHRAGTLAATLVAYGRNSLLLLLAGAFVGTCLGLGSALLLTWARYRGAVLAWAGAILWVVPTFLLAIGAQEIQFQVFKLTEVNVSGGYAVASPLVILWAGGVLAVRPAVYLFRRSRIAIADVASQEHVRTATAKGLPWRQVAISHIVRPALPIVIEAWLVSFRLMIGSLPLVEYFFNFPGIGGLFITQVTDLTDPDLVIAEIALVAGMLLLLEAVGGILQQFLDPRLLDLRQGSEAAR